MKWEANRERDVRKRDSEIFREEKWSEQKPSNGNITWFLNWFDNTQVMGPTIKIQTHQQLSTKTTISAKKSKRTSSTTAQASNHHNHNKKIKPKSLDWRPKSRKYEIKKRDEPIWQRGGEREREIAQLDAVWKIAGDRAQSDNYSVDLSFA